MPKQAEVVDYSGTEVPDDYECIKCKARNCKLWREHNAHSPFLLCAECAGKSQNKDTSTMNSEGRWSDPAIPEVSELSDQIGCFVPAVPTKNNATYWGYNMVPDDACAWWARLPTRSV